MPAISIKQQELEYDIRRLTDWIDSISRIERTLGSDIHHHHVENLAEARRYLERELTAKKKIADTGSFRQ